MSGTFLGTEIFFGDVICTDKFFVEIASVDVGTAENEEGNKEEEEDEEEEEGRTRGSDVFVSSVVEESASFLFKSVALLSAVMFELSRLCSASNRDTFCFCL